MKSFLLAAGVAALAITAPAAAERGDKGGEKGHAAKVERGGGKAMKADHGPKPREMRMATMRADRDKSDKRFERAEKRAEKRAKAQRDWAKDQAKSREKAMERRAKHEEKRFKAQRDWAKDEAKARDKAIERRFKAEERRFEAREKSMERRFKAEEKFAKQREKAIERRWKDRDERLSNRFWDEDDRWDDRFLRGTPAGFVDGCPPGLAKKSPACIPPGQAKQLIGQRVAQLSGLHDVPIGLRDVYRDTDDYYYRYGDGYLYRVDRQNDLIRALMPMFGLGLGIGQPFPYQSRDYYVPDYYQSFYPNSGSDYYRYANGYVYEIDGRSGLIEDIIPLYDRGYGVGQMLPDSYSYYNVPYQYRGWYPENDDYYYRYAPGAIYQVDRETQLITAIASLLTGNNGLAVGQMLPASYSAYNVPLSYRDRYYDRQDAWYRYSDGNIYQVDPTTRLITAIISAIT